MNYTAIATDIVAKHGMSNYKCHNISLEGVTYRYMNVQFLTA